MCFKCGLYFQTLASLLSAACIPSAIATVYNWVLLYWAFTEGNLSCLWIVSNDIGGKKVFHCSLLTFTVIWSAGAFLGFAHNWVSRCIKYRYSVVHVVVD